VHVSRMQIAIIATTAILVASFALMISRTSMGRAQRACAQDQTMVALLGINVDRTIAMTFVLGAGLAAVAGLMVSAYYGVVDFSMGFLAGMKAFTAAVLGGIGSLPGAVLGGLLIGVIEAMWSAYMSIQYKDVAVFAILIIVLTLRPAGLLGRAESEKI
jgi:branched-chain amino acid transport system permease protein